jgi:hypothetical protein
MRGNIDCLLERAGKSYSAMIELNQESGKEVVLRGLGLSQGVAVASVDLDGGEFVGRNERGEPVFQLTSAEGGKWGHWWRYTSVGAQGACYGSLYGSQGGKAHFTDIASIEVN